MKSLISSQAGIVNCVNLECIQCKPVDKAVTSLVYVKSDDDGDGDEI